MKIIKNIKIIFAAAVFFLLFAASASADSAGSRRNFYVDDGYDSDSRTSINAVLIKSGGMVNIYADETWWQFTSQPEARVAINNLSDEFDRKIYPTLTSFFGEEWSPGIDKDLKITILIESIKGDAGGYFRTHDEYSKLLVTNSNEREMIYINAKYILDHNLKAFVSHEFIHLITFFQKNAKFNVEEDTWLNEARAEYAPTLLGYNNDENSYLAKRAQQFSDSPSGSIVDWQNTKYDYGKSALFIHYLVDHYGIKILIDSLQSPKIGIESIDFALKKNGFTENFFKVFSDWTIAVLINDCSFGPKYCYLDKNLKSFYLSPAVNFLPVFGNTTLTFSDNIKYWSGNWYKIIGGGGGTLNFRFVGDPKTIFEVPYFKKNKLGNYVLEFMNLDSKQEGQISIENFGKEITSLFIIPLLQGNSKVQDNDFHKIFWSASITRQQDGDPEIQRLLAIIESLKKQIAELIEKNNKGENNLCSAINNNLYFGLANNNEVKCLQNFLKNQGIDIYPEGYVTGNFGNLTKQAVIKFQIKYGIPQTGFVGSLTRARINQILNGG